MAVSDGLIRTFELPELQLLFEKLRITAFNTTVRGFSMLLFLVFSFIICLIPENNHRTLNRLHAFNMIVCAIAFLWGFLCLSSESVFLYFDF